LKVLLLPQTTESVFGNVIAVAFQITFRVKIRANNIFFIFLKSFLTSAHQNNPKSLAVWLRLLFK